MTVATPNRAPAAPYRLMLPASADRADWLKARRTGIGSSDVADIMGVGYATPSRVYYDKRGELPLEDDAGEAALWGNLHEETVAREWARRNRSIVRRVGLIARRDARWMMCTLDRRIAECPLVPDAREQCALEVKTRNAFVAGKWRRDVPDDVLAQVLWQMAVTDFSHVHVACLIGGNDYRQYVVRRRDHAQVIADIITVARRMWHEHIVPGVPPATTGDPDRLVELYGQLHPGRTGVLDLASDAEKSVAVMGDLHEYETHRLAEAAAKRAKNTAKAALVGHLGDNEIVARSGDQVYSYEPASRRAVDLERLAERWPDAYDDVVTDSPSRRLSISAAYRLTPAKETSA